jgi:hypothetical protein
VPALKGWTVNSIAHIRHGTFSNQLSVQFFFKASLFEFICSLNLLILLIVKQHTFDNFIQVFSIGQILAIRIHYSFS